MRVVRSSTAESMVQGTILVAVALAVRMWFADLHVFGLVRIDAIVIWLSFLAISRGTTFGIITGFIVGIFLDAINPDWIGASAVGYSVVGFFSGSFGQTLYMEKSMARGLLVMGAVVIFDLIYGLLTVGFARSFWMAAGGTLGSAIISGAVTIVVTRVVRQWQESAASGAEAAGDG